MSAYECTWLTDGLEHDRKRGGELPSDMITWFKRDAMSTPPPHMSNHVIQSHTLIRGMCSKCC